MSVNVSNKLQVNSSYKGNDDLYADIPINFKNAGFVNKTNNSAFEQNECRPVEANGGVKKGKNRSK